MSNHHGSHRSSHHGRSRMHHSSSSSHYQSNRPRISSNGNMEGSSSRTSRNQHPPDNRGQSESKWIEHKSSSGRIYYYNSKTGVSQWEIPHELRNSRQISPDSEMSESSSIRQNQQQDSSSSSNVSSNSSSHSDSIPEDKPLLTPSLAQYFRPELIQNFISSHVDELENEAKSLARHTLILNEKILKEKADIKIAKSHLSLIDIELDALEKKYSVLKEAAIDLGFG